MKTCSLTVTLNTVRFTNQSGQSRVFDVALYAQCHIEITTKGYRLIDTIEFDDEDATVTYCYAK